MRNQLFTWPSVQVDPNIPKVSKLTFNGQKIKKLLANAPEDSDTIIEILTNTIQQLETIKLDKKQYIDNNMEALLTPIATNAYNSKVSELSANFNTATYLYNAVDAEIATKHIAEEIYVEDAIAAAIANM